MRVAVVWADDYFPVPEDFTPTAHEPVDGSLPPDPTEEEAFWINQRRLMEQQQKALEESQRKALLMEYHEKAEAWLDRIEARKEGAFNAKNLSQRHSRQAALALKRSR